MCTLILSSHADTLKSLDQKCKNKSSRACYELGIIHDQKAKVTLATKYYRQSCDLNYALACYKLGEQYLVGSGVKQSDAAFIRYMKKSCSLGYKKSCSFTAQAKPAIKPTKKIKNKKIVELKAVKKTKPTRIIKNSSLAMPNDIVIEVKNIGKIKIYAKVINKQKRIVQIKASMTNHHAQDSAWLSFSFPDIQQSALISNKSKGFAHIRSYPEGKSIYNIKQKKAMKSRYLLIEGEVKNWGKKVTKEVDIKIKIPHNIKILTIYTRATLKQGGKLKRIPRQGSMGQQGFHNHKITLNIGLGKKSVSIATTQLSALEAPHELVLTQASLSRKDKLVLLDKLLELSYYHRQRKAFEKQLSETLFGNAKYLTYIKSYDCKAKKRTGTHRCNIKISGQISKKNKSVSWEFHAEFTAKKDSDGLRITEMHSLDLLEE